MGNQQSKAELRRQLLKLRQSLPKNVWIEKSDCICTHIQSSPLYEEARTILAYMSFRQEPDLSSLFTGDRIWGLPRCVGKSLIWHSWQPEEPLTTGAYGIFEPHSDAPILQPDEVDLILVPAIGCDRFGYRLGYGGGYYDRLLKSPEWASKPTIGIVFDFACLPQLPIEPWDRQLHGICTETNLIMCNKEQTRTN